MTISLLKRCFFIVLFSVPAVLFAGDASPYGYKMISLAGHGANSKRSGDESGCWLGTASGDMKILGEGKKVLCEVPFALGRPDEDCCIAVGKGAPEKAELMVDDFPGQYVYLAHAALNADIWDEVSADITFKYSNGHTEKVVLDRWRDICSWSSCSTVPNSVLSWNADNGSGTVSVFVSKFPVKKEKDAEITSVEFSAAGMTWVIFGVTSGPDGVLLPIRRGKELFSRCSAAPLPESPLRDYPDNMKAPRNVILIIGDGMGNGAHDLTSLWCFGRKNALFMSALHHGGLSTTHSRSSDVTDSAAAGTAIATGFKVANGQIAVFSPDGPNLTAVSKLAAGSGRSVAIMTTDALNGATPAVFYANSSSRHDASGILRQIPDSGFEVFLANDSTAGWFDLPENSPTKSKLESAGYVFVKDAVSFAESVNAGHRVLGHISQPAIGRERELGDMASAVFESFSSNTNGFFVMIESHLPDKGGHANDPNLVVLGTAVADWTVKAAVDFASSRDDTLVIVTADHETGGVVASRPANGKTSVTFHSVSHTGSAVPLYSFGPCEELFDGVTDNTDIAETIARLWGLTLTTFPEM